MVNTLQPLLLCIYFLFFSEKAESVTGSVRACVQHAAHNHTGGHFVFLQ